MRYEIESAVTVGSSGDMNVNIQSKLSGLMFRCGKWLPVMPRLAALIAEDITEDISEDVPAQRRV